jgi:beta-glucosidase
MQPELQARGIGQVRVHRLRFKDHNGNGRLDRYEDWRLAPRERAVDLLARMSLQEKVGAMLHANPPTTQTAALPGAGSAWDFASLRDLVLGRHVGAFLNRLQAPPEELARQANELQALAEESRLGIPVLLSTDPRSHFSHSQGVSVAAGGFTQWPDAPGFGAAGDAELVRAFADGVRQEYRAVGIRMALSPMADLALEPRWHRCSGSFGSSPEDVRALVQAYVAGMQGGMDGLGPQSVVSVVKHWVGYGATGPQGFDAHNHYGRLLELRSDGVEEHVRAFTGAFEAGVGGVMPSYGVPPPGLRMPDVAGDIEQVGMSFNRQMVNGVLRGRFGFDGVVISDWHVTDDCTRACIEGAGEGQRPGAGDIAMPWGVEHLDKRERFAKAIRAGVDQFGGADDPRWIVSAVRDGLLAQSLIDRAVLRILVQKFSLGLFENPYVDENAASSIVGRSDLRAMALDAQRRSLVVAKNAGSVLPLARGRKLFLEGIDAQAAWAAGFTVVERPGDADLAVVAMRTPHELLHPGHFFGSRYREGRTGWLPGDADLERVRLIAAQVPTVASVYLDRPADLAALEPLAAGIVLHFGVQEEALFDVLSGRHAPAGRLPFDLPWPPSTRPPAGLAVRRAEGLSF